MSTQPQQDYQTDRRPESPETRAHVEDILTEERYEAISEEIGLEQDYSQLTQERKLKLARDMANGRFESLEFENGSFTVREIRNVLEDEAPKREESYDVKTEADNLDSCKQDGRLLRTNSEAAWFGEGGKATGEVTVLMDPDVLD